METKIISGRIDKRIFEELSSGGINISAEIQQWANSCLLTKGYYLQKKEKLLNELNDIDLAILSIEKEVEGEFSRLSYHQKEFLKELLDCSVESFLGVYHQQINSKAKCSVVLEIRRKISKK